VMLVDKQLGRETEDLKETRERLRKEVESAQNLTARKERMLAGMSTPLSPPTLLR
jgi:hypothetical protein